MRAWITMTTLFLATLLPAQGGRPGARAPQTPRLERPDPARVEQMRERMRELRARMGELRKEMQEGRGGEVRGGRGRGMQKGQGARPGLRLLLLRRLHAQRGGGKIGGLRGGAFRGGILGGAGRPGVFEPRRRIRA